MNINEKKAENTPAGGVLVGKKDGQTIIHDEGTMSGYLVGKLHKDGGIKAVNKATGQPLEMQGGEVIITAPAVSDQTKREFEGKMMTNREILSAINEKGGGVSFANGGDIPAKIHTNDCEYKLGGKVVKDTDIAHSLGMNSTLKKGKQHFSSGDTTYDVDAIYNAIKKGKLRLKTKEVETFPMKYPVYDKKYSETVKTDFRKPNGITVRTESGEEVLIDGNHRMNNAYLKGRKTMKTYYIEDPKQIAKFTKKNKFELGGNITIKKDPTELVGSKVKIDYKGGIYGDKNVDKKHLKTLKGANSERKQFGKITDVKRIGNTNKPNIYDDFLFEITFDDGQKDDYTLREINFYDQNNNYLIPSFSSVKLYADGGHLSKNKSLKQIAEMHNVSLAHVNEELAKGLEVEKEHFADFKERTRVAKDHLVENPNYYTILEKSGLKNGGHLIHHRHSDNLVKDAKSGNTPARDLNNYNDIMDLEADGMVGMESGLAFADGGIAPIDANIEGDSVDIVESDFAKGGVVYDTTKPKIEKVTIKDTLHSRASVIGRYASTVSELQQIVSDYIGNSPKENVDWIKFYVNDNTRGSYYIDLNKGKKNTVKNVNPETLNSVNFRRVIDAKDYLVKNYNWTDFFELGSQTATTSQASTNQSKYPEYYEYIGKESQSFTTGNIYKIINPNDLEAEANFIDNNGIANGFSLTNYGKFKPSTEQAYLAQQGGGSSTSAKTPLTKEDLFRSKIWIGDNVELRDKLIDKLIKIGIPFDKDNGNPDADKNIEIIIYAFDFILFEESKQRFDSDQYKEIFPEDVLGIGVIGSVNAPTSKIKKDEVKFIEVFYTLQNTSGVGSEKIYSPEKLVEFLRGLSNGNYKDVSFQPKGDRFIVSSKSYDVNDSVNKAVLFDKDDLAESNTMSKIAFEMFPDLDFSGFINKNTTTTASVKKPVVYKIKTYTNKKNNTSVANIISAESFEDLFIIIKALFAIKDELDDSVRLMIFSDNAEVKYSDLSLAVEEQLFDILTDIEAKENLMDSLSANNKELDFKEFFSKSQDKNVDYVIVKEPRSFPDGQNIYTGSAILPLLKEIYRNSPIEHTKVEIDLVVNGKAENAPLTLTLTGVPTYSDYEINPNDITEQILYSKLKIDWFPDYKWGRLFPLIEELDFYLEESYFPNDTTKNINQLFSKLNAPEVKNSNKQITLTWFGENGETHKFGAYFTNTVSGYYQIDRNNFNLDVLRDKLDDWFYGRLSEGYMFPDGQVKAKTPTSNSAVPKIIEQGVYNLDLAVQKLEKASSTVATEYNKEIYDQSLKFLYDTKATYELALKFTPESAFMYERLDLMKKLADIEKNIKKIEDMKKGGAFYMLAKIIERLQRGENWKTLEQSQDIITNQIPQSEIDVIIRSQKFKNWFGDWEKALVNDEYDNVSKALTDGIPSVYHHGARRIKYTYREVSNGVLYLAENISYATWFSQNATAQTEEGNYLTECFVNIKNPIDLTAFHVNKVDLADIVRYVDAVYPMAKIYEYIPAQVALLIKTNQPTNVRMWAWQLIRSYAKFVNHIKENTPYDGFLYYENNPSDQVINPATGQLEENVTKAVAIFKSPQVKVVDAVLFDGGLDDWRFENGGKIKN